ncbi:MAG TPA: hypothetical protein VEQ37_05625 [Actinomycetota bacterium]|nr:hypothetical protein [Actinomycetota bacterium]
MARPTFRHRLITLHIGRLATLGCAGGAPWQLGVALDVCTLAAEESLGAAIDSPRRNPRIGNVTGREGPSMPAIQGLSKAAANYRPADNPKFSCHECKFMFPRLAIGGCRYVRGVIHADDTCDEFKPRRPRTGAS